VTVHLQRDVERSRSSRVESADVLAVSRPPDGTAATDRERDIGLVDRYRRPTD
jgi:hypothetical protein